MAQTTSTQQPAAFDVNKSKEATLPLHLYHTSSNIDIKSLKPISVIELASHRNDNSAWTAIDSLVYDITDFTKQHPGGGIIRYAAGRDSTALFESYHSLKSMKLVNAKLRNCCKLVGRLVSATSSETVQADKTFFVAVKQRVEDHIKNQNLSIHSYSSLLVLEALITLAIYFIATYYCSVHGSIVGAIFIGICTGRLGFFMHTGNHSGISDSVWVNRFLGYFMDIIGSNNYIWGWEHQVAHHSCPNISGVDNDCEIGNPFVRMHPELPHSPAQRFQHITVPIAMSFGFIKWFIADFVALSTGKVGNIQFAVTKAEWYKLLVFKSFWLIIHVITPIYYCGLAKTALLAFLWLAIGAHYLENTFIVNHIQHGLVPPANSHWSVKQVLATSNWSSESLFFNWISGGLNHQIEHHLFPTISVHLYPQISPIIKNCCQEFNLPYYNYPTFTSAWIDMLSYLRCLGQPDYSSEKFTSKLGRQRQCNKKIM